MDLVQNYINGFRNAQYERLKLVMTPEAAKCFQETPRGARPNATFLSNDCLCDEGAFCQMCNPAAWKRIMDAPDGHMVRCDSEPVTLFQKPRCADCGKTLSSDETSRDVPEGTMCEECLEGRGGGVTCKSNFTDLTQDFLAYQSLEKLQRNQFVCKDCNMNHSGRSMSTKRHGSCHSCARRLEEAFSTPKIEQKPTCACCTAFALGGEIWDEKDCIRHEDPCQFSHTERWMLPKAKALFRATQERKHEENLERAERERQTRELGKAEGDLRLFGDDAIGRRAGMYRQALAGEVR